MKKFLLYLMIMISVVSLGLTIYYFSADNEVIYIRSSYLVVDVGETIPTSNLLTFNNKNNETTLSYGVKQSDSVLSFRSGNEFYLAEKGGESQIVINTSNRSYSQLIVNVLVCDGSEEYPYIVNSEETLKLIGAAGQTKYLSNMNYKLGSDITLTEDVAGNWTPISNFSGTFDGNYFSISNMNITDTTIGTLREIGFVSVLAQSGVIKNLTLNNVSINSSEATKIGSFAGRSEGKIQTSEANGSITCGNLVASYVGGVVGNLNYNTATPIIDRCGFEGKLSTINDSTLQVLGGVAGHNYGGKITESYYRSTNELMVENCNSCFGGIVGRNESATNIQTEIYDCYAFLTQVDSTKTNFSNMGGVIYKNEGLASAKSVMGNYYGGAFERTELSNGNVADDSGSAILNTRTNGYLTNVEFTVSDSASTKFITAISTENTRTWAFDSVWNMGNNYPVLNMYSPVGSTYILDISDIIGDEEILTAQELYNALSGIGIAANPTLSYKLVGTRVGDSYEIDFSKVSWTWGDVNHPIINSFGGTLTCLNGCTIKNLVINNRTLNSNVGLVKQLESTANISNIKFDNVTITGQNGNFVGVIAGLNNGASVYKTVIQNVDVQISGVAFGSFFGSSENVSGHGLELVKAKNIDAENNYYVYAGGLIGNNKASISANASYYSNVTNVKLYASYAGGVAGYNTGSISYVSASNIKFSKIQTEETVLNLYSGINNVSNSANVVVGGITGTNNGDISNVYANSIILAQSGANYRIYAGGICGSNKANISRAYVYSTMITVTSSHSSVVGGITGYNTGKIANSVVDNDCSIDAEINNNMGTTKSGNDLFLDISGCSVVGGLVGYDAYTTTSTYSIYQSVSNVRTIKGFYAGGLVGISCGRVEYCSCGIKNKTNGNVVVTGFFVGGLSSFILNGYVKDSFTICKLTTASFNGSYKDINSILNMDVSASAGFAILTLNNSTLQGCYCVVTFSGDGVSYGSCANLTGYSNEGKIVGCIYQTVGSLSTTHGKNLTEAELKGNGGLKFVTFFKYIGSENNNVWTVYTGSYPILEGIASRNPNSSLPTTID